MPHVHQSELSEQEHQLIHENEATDLVEVLALIFHEFTDEGEMEEIVVRQQDDTSFTPSQDFIPLIPFGLDLLETNQLIVTITFFISEKHPVVSGIHSSWGIRPPPFA